MNKLSTINLHLTDMCNYKCKFCFVNKEKRELTLNQIKLLVDKAKRYFDENKLKGRINLAGGEPLCYKNIQEVIDYIHNLGIEVSIITNGYLLNEEFISHNKGKLSMIGISVDSLNHETNLKIGRCCSNLSLSYEKLIDLCQCIKANEIKLKINTCVMKLNIDEDNSEFIRKVKPDRFKIFQEVPDTEFGKDNQITVFEFNEYLKKYKGLIVVNETSDYMDSNYLIIDSRGFLGINNRHKNGYNLLEDIEINECFDK